MTINAKIIVPVVAAAAVAVSCAEEPPAYQPPTGIYNVAIDRCVDQGHIESEESILYSPQDTPFIYGMNNLGDLLLEARATGEVRTVHNRLVSSCEELGTLTPSELQQVQARVSQRDSVSLGSEVHWTNASGKQHAFKGNYIIASTPLDLGDASIVID